MCVRGGTREIPAGGVGWTGMLRGAVGRSWRDVRGGG